MSFPPLPPKDSAARSRRRKQVLLDRIKSGDPTAEGDYKAFLIERGEYFYSLEEIFPESELVRYRVHDITVNHDGSKRNDWARAFIRTRQPDYLEQGGRDGVQEFVETKKSMIGKDSIASLSSSGHSSEEKKKNWDVDILARPLDESKSSQVAHLLPAAPDHAVEWYDIAC